MSHITINKPVFNQIYTSAGWRPWHSWYSDLLEARWSRLEPQWGWDFPDTPRPASRPTQPPVQWVLGLFPGSKVTGPRCRPPVPFQHQGTVRHSYTCACFVCNRTALAAYMGCTSLAFLNRKMVVAVLPLTQLPHSIPNITRLNGTILTQLQLKTLKRVGDRM